jgi:hypothetical protein
MFTNLLDLSLCVAAILIRRRPLLLVPVGAGGLYVTCIIDEATLSFMFDGGSH